MTSNKPTGKRVLLADDEPGVREAVSLLLTMDGHIVVPAANGREALENFESARFDLVITDYEMVGMAGNELACNIKRAAPAMPIIMITGQTHVLKGADNPVDAVLTKPFGFEDLRRTIALLTGVAEVT